MSVPARCSLCLLRNSALRSRRLERAHAHPRRVWHPAELLGRGPRAAPPETPVSPEPAGETNETNQNDPYKVNKDDNSTYLEAPKLFNPKDRTARRSASIAPVHTAVYKQPVATRTAAAATVTRGPVSDEQARIDAIGWTSASK